MNRREFLRTTLLASAGGILLPSFLSSCRKNMLLDEAKFSGKVLIIGAGAAGLYAGYILKSKGIDFQILEAAPVHGGRMGKLTGFADYSIDLGAQWMHGRNSILGDLAVRSGTSFSIDNSEEKFWLNGSIVSTLPQTPDLESYDDLTDISFKDFFHSKGFGPEYDNIIEAIAGDYGADASRISASETVREEENWCSGLDDFKFAETFFDFIDREIAQKVLPNITLNTVVTTVDYTGSNITVRDSAGNFYFADRVIITVPITILKAGDITFNPALPEEQTTAFSKIGMDAGMKVFLKFSNKFYDDIIGGGSICAAYADDTVGKTTNDNVLLAFIMGEQAEYLTSLGSDAAITNALLGELDTMYNGQATASFISSHVQNWTTSPFVRGAYSYSAIGIGNARRIAARAVRDRIYFAGEAMNTSGHHQSVHGAVETGYNAVIQLLTDTLG
jgi:lysine-specific histone demethylase 1B